MQKNVIDKMIKCVMSVYCVMWHNKKKNKIEKLLC